MIGLSEILIVVLSFGLVGVYVFLLSRFIRAAEKETAEADKAERRSKAA